MPPGNDSVPRPHLSLVPAVPGLQPDARPAPGRRAAPPMRPPAAGEPMVPVRLAAVTDRCWQCRAKVREYVEAGCTCPVLYPLGDDVRAMIDAFAPNQGG